MDPVLVSLLSGLAGAVIGAVASTAGVFITARFESKRHLSKLAYEAALADYKSALENGNGPRRIYPLTSYVYFHGKYMQLIGDDKLSKESLEQLRAELDTLWPKE